VTFSIVSDFRFINAIHDGSMAWGMNCSVVIACHFFTLKRALFHNGFALAVVSTFTSVLYTGCFLFVVDDGRFAVVCEVICLSMLLTIQSYRSYLLEKRSIDLVLNVDSMNSS
jgi:hypothetical protein